MKAKEQTAAETYLAAAAEIETLMEALVDALEQQHTEDPAWMDVSRMKSVRDLLRGALATARGRA